MEKKKGITLIKVLVIVGIMGALTTTGAAALFRHLISAKAAEAPQIMGAVISYCKGYHQAHGSWPPNKCDTHNKNTNEWIDEVVGKKNAYFDYYYDKKKLQVRAEGKKRPFTKADKLIYHLVTRKWSATERMVDVRP